MESWSNLEEMNRLMCQCGVCHYILYFWSATFILLTEECGDISSMRGRLSFCMLYVLYFLWEEGGGLGHATAQKTHIKLGC